MVLSHWFTCKRFFFFVGNNNVCEVTMRMYTLCTYYILRSLSPLPLWLESYKICVWSISISHHRRRKNQFIHWNYCTLQWIEFSTLGCAFWMKISHERCSFTICLDLLIFISTLIHRSKILKNIFIPCM